MLGNNLPPDTVDSQYKCKSLIINNILNNAELILKYNNNKFPRYVLNQLINN